MKRDGNRAQGSQPNSGVNTPVKDSLKGRDVKGKSMDILYLLEVDDTAGTTNSNQKSKDNNRPPNWGTTTDSGGAVKTTSLKFEHFDDIPE